MKTRSKIQKTFLTCLISVGLVGAVSGAPGPDALEQPGFKTILNATSRTAVSARSQPIDLKALQLPPLRQRLVQPKSQRNGTFGNSRVDLAPKSWPYPMVVSPGRPVLPGSAW
jgi:hypothetical protein